MTTFNAPSSGKRNTDRLAISDVEGHVVLVYVKSYEFSVQTSNGVSDAVRLNVLDLDTGALHRDVLWFARFIVAQLRDEVGTLVLGSIGKGTAQPPKSAPWMLNDVTDSPKAVAAAEAWLAANPGVLDEAPTINAPATGVPASSLL